MNQYELGMKLWNARTGELVKDIVSGSYSSGAFSPDGRWLLTSDAAQGPRLWEVGIWQPKSLRNWSTGGGFSSDGFSPDSKTILLSLPGDRTQIELLDVATGEQLAVLTSPDGTRISAGPLAGNGAIFPAATPSGLQVWDLAAVRRRLRSMGLDWNADEPLPDSVPMNRSELWCTLREK